jgi:hypothetical protein
MESNWKEATPSDRVVLLKNVSSNLLLDGLNVRYDLKKPFAILSEIKLKGVSERWCRLPQATRTREACSFADLQNDLGSVISKFDRSCKTSVG